MNWTFKYLHISQYIPLGYRSNFCDVTRDPKLYVPFNSPTNRINLVFRPITSSPFRSWNSKKFPISLSLSLSLCACERGRVVCIIKRCYETTTDGSEERSGQRRVNCAVDTSWKYAVDKVAITFSSLSTYAFWARRARATCATGVILGQKRAVHREGGGARPLLFKPSRSPFLGLERIRIRGTGFSLSLFLGEMEGEAPSSSLF